ncbi:TonB-dependent receptor, partial [Campylobacter jejuni]|nr:TonB-dependent receptor [Campylobacter jejuni]
TLPSGDYAMAGTKEVNGLELGFSCSITPAWQVFGGYTFMKSKLKDGSGADVGNYFPNTPENSFSLWSTYAVTADVSLGGGAY